VTDSDSFPYQGQELDVFAHARHWKNYWASRINRWVRGNVLEIGAGTGANTVQLQNENVRSWLCIEPDPQLVTKLAQAVAQLPSCSVTRGTITSVSDRRFDSILYVDVLEHIETDRSELAAAATLLRPGGHVVVLAPAHQFLFSEFDAAIGHYRRYNRTSLCFCSPPNCRLEAMFYLDSAGVVSSLANRFILRQSLPTLRQIKTWDNYIVPVSRFLDPLLGYAVGKTIVGVWTHHDDRIPVQPLQTT
jgi:SAM-dependent methyltransferase